MLIISRVHHIAVICSDYAASKTFYTQILGCSIIQETYREERGSHKLDLDLQGRAQIELFSFPDSPQRASYPEARGLRHLAFEVPDLAEAVNELTAQGIPVEPVRLDALTGKQFTFFADPDGLPLELYEGLSL